MSLKGLKAEAEATRCARHTDVPLTVRAIGIVCPRCKAPPDSVVEAPGTYKRWARGEPVSAAVDSKLKRKHGMTEEQSTAVQQIRSQPPSWSPSKDDLQAIRALFSGWMPKDRSTGKPQPIEPSTAYTLWSLINMGFSPNQIHILGGRPYVNLEGMIWHAGQVAASQGRAYGGIRFQIVKDEDERELAGINPDQDHIMCVKAIYVEERPQKSGNLVPLAEEYGKASRDPSKGTVVKQHGKNHPVEEANPAEMARARAVRRVLRLAFGIGMPGGTAESDEEPPRVTVDEPDYVLPYGQPEGDAIEDAEPETVEAQELPWEQEESN